MLIGVKECRMLVNILIKYSVSRAQKPFNYKILPGHDRKIRPKMMAGLGPFFLSLSLSIIINNDEIFSLSL